MRKKRSKIWCTIETARAFNQLCEEIKRSPKMMYSPSRCELLVHIMQVYKGDQKPL